MALEYAQKNKVLADDGAWEKSLCPSCNASGEALQPYETVGL